MRKYIAVIQAGGKGTRMEPLTRHEIPKPMLMLNGKPMLQWQIESVAAYGIREIVIIIGHLGYKIKEYFQDGACLNVHINYIEETMPLGSAGALYYLNSMYEDHDYLLIYGDVMFQLDWTRMIAYHEGRDSQATLLAHPNSHPYDSDLLILDSDGRVLGIDAKTNVRNDWYDNCVNAGIYILKEELVREINTPHVCDLEQDILLPRMKQGKIYAYRTTEYVKDAGTPERFAVVRAEQKKGVWEQRCLTSRQKCIFLDRDGTINVKNGFISSAEQLELEEHAAEAIRQINESGYLAIIVTNQPVVARGSCTMEEVQYIHKKLQVLLGQAGAYVDDIIFCPHHPDGGYPGENPLYKVRCHCRKPETGMIEAMTQRYNIDISQSYMIGDTTRDIQTGVNAGLKTVLVLTGDAGKDGKYMAKPDVIADNLYEAVNTIID